MHTRTGVHGLANLMPPATSKGGKPARIRLHGNPERRTNSVRLCRRSSMRRLSVRAIERAGVRTCVPTRVCAQHCAQRACERVRVCATTQLIGPPHSSRPHTRCNLPLIATKRATKSRPCMTICPRHVFDTSHRAASALGMYSQTRAARLGCAGKTRDFWRGRWVRAGLLASEPVRVQSTQGAVRLRPVMKKSGW